MAEDAGKNQAAEKLEIDQEAIDRLLEEEIEGKKSEAPKTAKVKTKYGEVEYEEGNEEDFEQKLEELIAANKKGGSDSGGEFQFGDPELKEEDDEFKPEEFKPGDFQVGEADVETDAGLVKTLKGMHQSINEQVISAMQTMEKNLMGKLMGMAREGERTNRISAYEAAFTKAAKQAGGSEKDLEKARDWLRENHSDLIKYDDKSGRYSYRKGALEKYAKQHYRKNQQAGILAKLRASRERGGMGNHGGKEEGGKHIEEKLKTVKTPEDADKLMKENQARWLSGKN